MNTVLVFVHFFGLMLGAAGGMASGMIMRKAMTMPDDQARAVRGLGPFLAKASLVGLALMWASGLIMVWSRWNGPEHLPGTFWIKALFIVALTAITIMIDRTYAQLRSGNTRAAARLPILGMAAGVSSLFTVLFAVISFS